MSFCSSLRHVQVANLHVPLLATFLSTIVEHVKKQVLSANCDTEQPKSNAKQHENKKNK